MFRYFHILLLVTLFSSYSFGYWVYELRSPLLGRLGKVTILPNTKKGNKYRVEIKLESTGIAAFMAHNRREKYISEGKIHKGSYQTKRMKVRHKSGKLNQVDEYKFDYRRNRIKRHKIRWKRGKVDKDLTDYLKYFTTMDAIALYKNIIIPLSKQNNSWRRSYLVAGMEKSGGRVIVTVPDKKRKEYELKKLGIKNAQIVILSSPGTILKKKNREMILAINQDGVVLKGRIPNMPIVGNVYIILTQHKSITKK